MDLNATLIGQMITFGIFVWFTMKVVWPMLESSMEERKLKISDGLAAAEKGHKTLQDSQYQAKVELQKAKEHSMNIIKRAEMQAQQIIEDAKKHGLKERQDIVSSGHLEVEQAVNLAKSELEQKVADIVVKGTEKILNRTFNLDDHQDILNNLAKEL